LLVQGVLADQADIAAISAQLLHVGVLDGRCESEGVGPARFAGDQGDGDFIGQVGVAVAGVLSDPVGRGHTAVLGSEHGCRAINVKDQPPAQGGRIRLDV
jgi:hypothetical protein